MKKIARKVAALGFIVGLGMVQLPAAQAAEHGGKEHGGAAATGQEHGGGAAASAADKSEADVLRQAADALRNGESRPDLAEELEKLAKQHGG